MPISFWLCKSEPGTYSFHQLIRDKKTHWDGIRNFQARNFLRQMKVGDRVLIYHSGNEKAVVGIAEVVREAYPDIDPEGGDWAQVDLKGIEPLRAPVPLSQIKATPALGKLPLIRHTRLSVMPVTRADYQTLVKLGGSKA